jgi:hypothetical protein
MSGNRLMRSNSAPRAAIATSCVRRRREWKRHIIRIRQRHGLVRGQRRGEQLAAYLPSRGRYREPVRLRSTTYHKSDRARLPELSGIQSALTLSISPLKETSWILLQQAIPRSASDKLLELTSVCVIVGLGVAVAIIVAAFWLVFRLSRSQQEHRRTKNVVLLPIASSGPTTAPRHGLMESKEYWTRVAR